MYSNFKFFAFLLVLSASIIGVPTTSLDDEDDDHYAEAAEESDLSNNTDATTLGWDFPSNESTNENFQYTIKRVNLSAFVWPSSSPAPKAIDYGIDQTIRTVFKDKPEMWNYVAGLMSELMFPSTSSRPQRSRYYPLPPEEVYSTVKLEEMKPTLRPDVEEAATPIANLLVNLLEDSTLFDTVLDVRQHSEDALPPATQFRRNFNSSRSSNKTAIDRAATLLDILRALNLSYDTSMDERSFEAGDWKKLFDDSSNNFFLNASWVNATKNSTVAKPRDSHIFSNETESGSWSRISILDPSVDLSNAHPETSTDFEELMELIDNLTKHLKDEKFDLNSSRFDIINFTIPPETESPLNYSTSMRFPRDRNESRSGNESIDVRSGDKLFGSVNSSKDGKVKFFEEVYDLQNVGFWFVKSGYKVNESTSNLKYETPANWSINGRSFQPFINSSDLMNFTVRSHPNSAFTPQFSEILQNMADKIANETKKIHQEIEVFLKDNKDHIVVHTFNDNYAYNLTDRNSSNAKTNYDALTELELRMENEIKDVINSSIDDELDVKLSRSGRDSLLDAFHHWLSSAFSDMCRVNYTNEECQKLLQSIRTDLQPLNSSLAPTSQPHFTTTTHGTPSPTLLKSLKETLQNVNFTEPEKPHARFFNPQHSNLSDLHDKAMDEMEAVHTSPEFHRASQNEMHDIESPLKNDSNYLRQLAESYEGRNNTKDRYYLKGSHQSRSTNLTLEVHHLLKDLDHPKNVSNARMARNGEFTFIGNKSASNSNESLARTTHEHDLEITDAENSSVKQTIKPSKEERFRNESESVMTASTTQTEMGRQIEELNFNVSTEPPQIRMEINDSERLNASMEPIGRSEEDGFNLNATSQPAEFRIAMNDSGLDNASMELMGRSENDFNLNATSEPAKFRTAMNDSGLHNVSTELMGRSQEDDFNLNATSEPAEFRTGMNGSGLHNASMELMGRSEDGFNLNATSQPAEFRTEMNDSALHNASIEPMGRSEDDLNLNATSQPAEFRTGMNDSGLHNVSTELMGRSEEDGLNLNATSQPAEFRTAINDSGLHNVSTEQMGRSQEDGFNLNATSEPAEFRTGMNGSSLHNASMELMGRSEEGFNLNATSEPTEFKTGMNGSSLHNASMELMGRSEEGFNLNVTSEPAEVRTGMNDSGLHNASTNLGRNVEGKFNLTVQDPTEFRNSLEKHSVNNSYIDASLEPFELSRAVNETVSNVSISGEMGRDAANDSDFNLLMERSLQNKSAVMNSTKLDKTFANKTNVNDSKTFKDLEITGRNETVAKFNESMGTLEFRSAEENVSNFTQLDGRDKPAVVDFLLDKIKNLVNGTKVFEETTRRRKIRTTPFSTTPGEVSTTTVYKTETVTEYHLASSNNYEPTEPANNYHNTNFLPIFGANNKMSLDNYLHQSDEAEKHSDVEQREPFLFPTTKICYRNEDCATELYEICIHTLFTNYCDCPHTMSRNKITNVCRVSFFDNYPYYPAGYRPRHKRSGNDVAVVQTR